MSLIKNKAKSLFLANLKTQLTSQANNKLPVKQIVKLMVSG